MIRLLASDLDGTLLAPDGYLSPRTAAAIASAASAGITVVAVTGRSHLTAEYRLRSSPHLRTIVCSNGALVYDLESDRIERVRGISGDDLRELFGGLRREIPELSFGWESRDGFAIEPGFGWGPGGGDGESLMGGPQTVGEVAEAVKAFVSHPEIEEIELQELVRPHLTRGLNAATSGARFVEVTAAGVNKGTTLALLASEWGYDSAEVMAIGDHMNDESMLDWAGMAVAMGNAVGAIKSIADVIAPSVHEEGAAKIIEDLVAGRIAAAQ